MKITQEMIDDWRSPDGYSDLNGSWIGHEVRTFYYNGGMVVVHSDNGYAVEAREGHRGKLLLIPVWRSIDDGFLESLSTPMTEPEFSLDEMSIAEDIMETLK